MGKMLKLWQIILLAQRTPLQGSSFSKDKIFYCIPEIMMGKKIAPAYDTKSLNKMKPSMELRGYPTRFPGDVSNKRTTKLGTYNRG